MKSKKKIASEFDENSESRISIKKVKILLLKNTKYNLRCLRWSQNIFWDQLKFDLLLTDFFKLNQGLSLLFFGKKKSIQDNRNPGKNESSKVGRFEVWTM